MARGHAVAHLWMGIVGTRAVVLAWAPSIVLGAMRAMNTIRLPRGYQQVGRRKRLKPDLFSKLRLWARGYNSSNSIKSNLSLPPEAIWRMGVVLVQIQKTLCETLC